MADIVSENSSTVSVHFNGVVELLEYDAGKQKAEYKKYLHDNDMGSGWFGYKNNTANDVTTKALLGDAYLFEKLKEHIAELDKLTGYYTTAYEQVLQTSKRRRFRGPAGDELDIHKVYQGRLDTAWSKTERIEVGQKQHLVTLLIDLGGNCAQDVAASLWRAAIVIKLARELELAGKAVKIVTGIAARSAFVESDVRRKILTSTIVVKDFNQPIVLPRLAAMTHFGFMRTFCFAAFHLQPHKLSSGLGRPVDMVGSNMPIQLQEEIDMGITKFVYIGRAMDSSSAFYHLKHAYTQMQEFANE